MHIPCGSTCRREDRWPSLFSCGNLFSSMPLSLSRYQSAAMRKQIAAVLRESQFDSVVCDFLSPAPNFDHLANCVLFQHNVETMIWRRHAEKRPIRCGSYISRCRPTACFAGSVACAGRRPR